MFRGQVAFIGTLREQDAVVSAGSPVVIALRLKAERRQISEIELFVVRTEFRGQRAAQNVENLGAPHRLFLEAVPLAERMSRADLIKTANMYFSGMQLNDGR